MTGARVAVGLGSNRGDRAAYLALGRRRLAALLDELACSEVYETAPVEGAGTRPFLNLCCVGRTSREPAELLERLQVVEAEAGRPPPGTADRSGARTLDLDLLLYGARRVEAPGLAVPHPRLAERAFVLVPLSEVAPEWPVPGRNATVRQLAERVEHDGVARVGPLEALTADEDDDG